MLTSKQSSQASGCRVTGLGRSLLFISQCVFAGAVSANIPVPDIPEPVVFSFEESGVPEYVKPQDSSSVQLSTQNAIHGSHSLKWDWNAPSAVLKIDNSSPINLITDVEARDALGRPATHVLSFWIYNQQAQANSKKLQVFLNDDISHKTEVSLDFIGWRTFGVSLVNDHYKCNKKSENECNIGSINSISFKAPDVSKGSLLIDRIMFSIDDNRYQWSDYHIQIERHPYTEIDFGIGNDVPQGASDEYDGIHSIQDRLTDYLTSSGLASPDSIRKNYKTLHIADDLQQPLRHVITDKQQVIYQPKHLSGIDKEYFDAYALLGDKDDQGDKAAGYAKLMLDIGKAYHQDAFQADRDELAKMYITLTEHLLDQGFYQGSALVTTHHWGYSGRWWYLSALLMAEPLKAEGLLAPVYDALVWYSREFKESFDMDYRAESSNLDYFNTLSIQHLVLLLLELDEDRRIALVHKFSDFISESLIQVPPGFFDGFRPDGTVWRHKGNYPGYSFAAMDNVAKVIYFLSDTPFAISDDAKAVLKKAMVAGWVYTNPVVGIGNSGRHPFTDLGVRKYAEGMKYLALSGNTETGDSVDEELAAIYLQVTGKSAQDSQSIFGLNINPATLPEGHWSFNGGAFGIHRYQGTMVTLKAYNSNVWSSEIYAADNRYGRYQSHGSVQIMPYGDPESFGYLEDGWDWNRNPGSTTIHLDWDTLESPNSGTLMVFSDEAFSGSASLDNQFGLFAFKHKAPDRPNFDPTFVARKSVLAIGNRLIMLGSDISNSSKTNTETTLFQHGITGSSDSTVVKGNEIVERNYSETLGKNDWLIDGMGNGYLIVSDSEVKVTRGLQTSRHNKTKKATEGEFATAWINHGSAPKGAGYEYQVVLEATPDQMSALSASLRQDDAGYKVLRKDEQFHIVQDQDSGVTGYVAFEQGETGVTDGLVTYIDKPALVMTRTLDSGHVSLTAVSPGLNMPHPETSEDPKPEDTAHKPVDVTVTLNGLWKLTEDSLQGVQLTKLSDSTEVTFTSDFGQSPSIELKPESEGPGNPAPPTSEGGGEGGDESGDEGGGAIGWMTLLALLSAFVLRKKTNNVIFRS